eukprot:TRINITY_DN14484_c0_g1_i1.p2 TRINITY_DN14484_c0_g1~~TRINITY_DN14484_c0_g1_i1.p2  ORF type:complete len:131 (+),score=28.36 TRINITY_DN14484_c0_g1_i1:38-394(+)
MVRIVNGQIVPDSEIPKLIPPLPPVQVPQTQSLLPYGTQNVEIFGKIVNYTHVMIVCFITTLLLGLKGFLIIGLVYGLNHLYKTKYANRTSVLPIYQSEPSNRGGIRTIKDFPTTNRQ